MICAFERLSLNNLSLNSNMFTRPSLPSFAMERCFQDGREGPTHEMFMMQ